MSTLNADQQHAVDVALETGVSTLVLGGPGTGKTHTLTHICASLLRAAHVAPDAICMLTFTRKAAREMEERLTRHLGASSGITSGTFHSVALHFLAHHCDLRLHLVEDDDVLLGQALHNVVSQREMPPFFHAASFKRELQRTRLRLECHPQWQPRALHRQILDEYRRLKLAAGCVDFHDLLVLMRQHMGKFPRVAYVLVDEFQDLNPIQIEIIRALHQRGTTVVAIGDDNQTIYDFRGSDVRTILDFGSTFAPAQQVVLGCNYRNPPQVVALSERILGNLTQRIPREVHAQGASGTVACHDHEEALARVLAHQGQGQFVLARLRSTLADFAAVLRKRGVPYTLHEPLQMSPDYPLLLTLGYLRDGAVAAATPYWRKVVGEEHDAADLATALPPCAPSLWTAMQAAAAAPNLAAALEALAGHMDAQLVAKLQHHAQQQPDVSLLTVLPEVSESVVRGTGEGIELMTVHQAKGLEAPIVHVLALHTFRASDEDYRVLFVAVTRTQKHLYLYHDRSRALKVRILPLC